MNEKIKQLQNTAGIQVVRTLMSGCLLYTSPSPRD